MTDDSQNLIRSDGVLPSPSEMVGYLDRFVFGQSQAKRSLATSVYNHYIGLAQREAGEVEGPDPQHVLFIGPTGTGKSFIVKTLARGLGLPFQFASATSLVQTGYVGTPVGEIVRRLVESEGGNVKRAQRGIIFIDEFDKVRCHDHEGSLDVSGEGVQIGLLTLFDGTRVHLRPPSNNASGWSGTVDTSQILFVCGGAFVGLEERVGDRLNKDRVGFRPPPEETVSALGRMDVSDLVAFGLIPELVGRFSSWVVLDDLDEQDLVRILTTSENSVLDRRRAFWRGHGIDLVFTEAALEEVARQSLSLGTGARALRWVVERSLDDVDYRPVELARAGVRRIVVDAATVRREGAPRLESGAPRPELSATIDDLRRRAVAPGAPRPARPRPTDAARRVAFEELSEAIHDLFDDLPHHSDDPDAPEDSSR